jgi:hypothetical protein
MRHPEKQIQVYYYIIIMIFGATGATLTPNKLDCSPLPVATGLFLELPL